MSYFEKYKQWCTWSVKDNAFIFDCKLGYYDDIKAIVSECFYNRFYNSVQEMSAEEQEEILFNIFNDCNQNESIFYIKDIKHMIKIEVFEENEDININDKYYVRGYSSDYTINDLSEIININDFEYWLDKLFDIFVSDRWYVNNDIYKIFSDIRYDINKYFEEYEI